jgi:hypothetical protein
VGPLIPPPVTSSLVPSPRPPGWPSACELDELYNCWLGWPSITWLGWPNACWLCWPSICWLGWLGTSWLGRPSTNWLDWPSVSWLGWPCASWLGWPSVCRLGWDNIICWLGWANVSWLGWARASWLVLWWSSRRETMLCTWLNISTTIKQITVDSCHSPTDHSHTAALPPMAVMGRKKGTETFLKGPCHDFDKCWNLCE